MPLTHAACPVSGHRIILVSGTNAAGDDIHRYECPNADWFGPWFSGDPTGEIHISQLPEVTRSPIFDGRVGPAPTVAADVNIINSIPLVVTGPLTDAQLRATPVPVSGTVTANQGTSPWVVSGTVAVSGEVEVKNDSGNPIPVNGTVTSNQGGSNWTVRDMNKMVPFLYDFVDLDYDGSSRLVLATFKTGGSGGTTVATLTITYVGATTNIDTVTRT